MWVSHGMPVYWRKSPHRWLQNDSPNGKILELRTGGVRCWNGCLCKGGDRVLGGRWKQRGYSVKYTKCGAQ